MNNPQQALEHYLNRATRGTWGTHRATLKAELRGNIEARAWRHTVDGLDATAALELALHEMGAPTALAAGFFKVHTMPTLFRTSLASAITVGALAALWPSGQAQIEAIPTPRSSADIPNLKARPISKFDGFYLNMASIKRNLEATGISVEESWQEAVETTQFTRDKDLPTLRFTFPGAVNSTTIQTAPGFNSPWKDGSGKLVFNPKPSEPISLEQTYIHFMPFLHQLHSAGLAITLNGWKNPFLSVGGTRLQLGTDSNPLIPGQMYMMIAAHFLGEFNTTWTSLVQPHAVRVNAPAGTVYAIVTHKDSIKPFIDVARVASDGVLYFDAPRPYLRFVDSKAELERDPMQFSAHDYGTAAQPAKALLIRISSDLKASVETPARTRSVALK